MKHGSLFSGIGGFDLASRWAGFENVWQCEINPYCRELLKKRFPEVKTLYGDIRELKGAEHVDIISGGFPCQPFSQAGKRKGQADNRFLWPEMLRVIAEVKPRWVVGENVSGLYTIDNGEVFERVCRELGLLGYTVQPIRVPACAVGAPHRRDRWWFVAHAELCGRVHREPEIKPTETGEQAQRNATAGLVASAGREYAPDSEQLRPVQCEPEGRTRPGEGLLEGSNSDAPNPEHYGIIRTEKSRKYNETQPKTKTGKELSRDELEGTNCIPGLSSEASTDAPDTYQIRLSRPLGNGELERKGLTESGSEVHYERTRETWSKNWIEVATRFCRVDDGLSYELDGLKLSRAGHRVERLKGLGNAIVPQVAYAIFEAIKEVDTP
jgi:DNA (cytosine-5)-methyltransferase 1